MHEVNVKAGQDSMDRMDSMNNNGTGYQSSSCITADAAWWTYAARYDSVKVHVLAPSLGTDGTWSLQRNGTVITLSADDVRANIRDTFSRATSDDIVKYSRWYRRMARMLSRMGRVADIDAERVAGVYASGSINTSWKMNCRYAKDAIRAHMAGNDITSAVIPFGMMRDKMAGMLSGDDINTTLSSDKTNFKLKCFRCNNNGCETCITVDRWAYRIAVAFADCPRRDGCAVNKKTGEYVNRGTHACGKVPTGGEYVMMANMYRDIATEVNVTNAALQAITWCVVRGTDA